MRLEKEGKIDSNIRVNIKDDIENDTKDNVKGKDMIKDESKTEDITKVRIELNNNVYDIDIEKLYYVINLLKGGELVKFEDCKKTEEYIKELKLNNDMFLKNVNKLW